ncbi:MAG TPA: hypothetical protein VHZ04_02670 [Candidatus Paceibacterota bacterium]|nr:hypothetical protein [Candidatus Paceibacterota bacterium]
MVIPPGQSAGASGDGTGSSIEFSAKNNGRAREKIHALAKEQEFGLPDHFEKIKQDGTRKTIRLF